ncbi:AAA family ATPase [Ruminococcus sp. HUN007]|uniref:AAA family ATPase n=1 Tax=Ruminococcus sp. HUN007 TaxID=1514668 RepID=UPI0005D20949|nr:AAA family ATPase [Ruminococcus sp. HUN007]
MLLKSITLTDFRQFKGTQKVEFATDSQKNVTVIMGVNGSGKTTLAQAFTWCLYGKTDFSDPNVLCKATLQEMGQNTSKTVSVAIELRHNGIDYTITRKQVYTVDMVGTLRKPLFAEQEIAFKDRDGNRRFVPDFERDYKIKEILPFELSKYFFFDGERIGNMSKEIQSGKSDEFADAVKNLLGLKSYISAMTHLKGVRAGKNTVIGSYNDQYSDDADGKIREYSNKIMSFETELDSKNKRIDELNQRLEIINQKKIDLSIIIEKNKSSEQLANQKKILESDIKHKKERISGYTTAMIANFGLYYKNHFSKKMMIDALSVLSETDKLDKGVPDIHKRTIEFLIKRGCCICGNPITLDSDEYKTLIDLLQYIPPKALGNMINDFVKECKTKIENTPDLFELLKRDVADKRTEENSLDRDYRLMKSIVDDISKLDDVGSIQQELNKINDEEKKTRYELNELTKRVGVLNSEIEKNETLRKELSLKNDNNRKIELYKAYAERIFNVIKNDYDNQENIVRSKLEENINTIFKKIYNGGLSLKIDERYNVQTIVNDFNSYNEGVETSTAQSISIIFAFIAGVIKVARENDQTNEMLSTEAYPLVMDAPLSAFDKERIQTVCSTLPNIAEQVIIFIKDTDGEIAEKYLSSKIGMNYSFDKVNEFETNLMQR